MRELKLLAVMVALIVAVNSWPEREPVPFVRPEGIELPRRPGRYKNIPESFCDYLMSHETAFDDLSCEPSYQA